MSTGFSPESDWQFDHIGVVVQSLEKGRGVFGPVFGIARWTSPIEDPVNGVRLQFGRDPTGLVYELLVPLDQKSPVQIALQQRKNILNHVAYRIPDLAVAARHMREARCMAIAEAKPAVAFDNRLIQFFVTPIGVVVELIEAPDFSHDFQLSPSPQDQERS